MVLHFGLPIVISDSLNGAYYMSAKNRDGAYILRFFFFSTTIILLYFNFHIINFWDFRRERASL